MRRFHELAVERVAKETADSIRVRLAVPKALQPEFAFLPGQHLPIEAVVGGKTLRRTYSVCSSPQEEGLEIGIRIQPGGAFSTYAARSIEAGSSLRAMTPSGRFVVETDAATSRRVAAFAAGSGITPILAIVRAVLEDEPDSDVMLFYGNRTQQSTMFIEDLYALKNRFPDRLQLHFLFSREDQEHAIAAGRLDGDKTAALLAAFSRDRLPDTAFVCGPETMIDSVSAALTEAGVPPAAVHSERFGVPRRRTGSAAAATTVEPAGDVSVTVIMDGHRRRFEMHDDGRSLVEAAAAAGIELPYSCKGGVCATCRTHLKEGKVSMDTNYGLEPWEVEQGFVLACQSHPLSEKLTLDYDRS